MSQQHTRKGSPETEATGRPPFSPSRAAFDIFTSERMGLVPPSTGGASAFLREDGEWAVPPGGGGGGAPVDAEYIVAVSNGTLTVERVLTDTASITWDKTTAGQVKANAVVATETTPGIVELAADGEVIAGRAVQGNDARLADARTPQPHSHMAGDLPAATTLATGVVELAEDGETSAGRAVQGNDSRLSDARTPTPHSHTAVDLPPATTTGAGVVELATDGESAPGVVVQGNDARLSDARTPVGHSHGAGDLPTATEVSSGVVQLAADEEVAAGKAVQADDARLSNNRSPTVHGHPASDITTGVLSPDRLATGTRDGTKFLRDDGTWQEASGGGSTPDATTEVKGKVELATDGESAAGVVVQGNDSRLSDARAPTSHSHTGGDLPAASTTVAGIVELATDGEAIADRAVQGNDSRLSDARAPTPHTHNGTDISDETLPPSVVSDPEEWRTHLEVAEQAHAHTATQITSGTLSDARLSAFLQAVAALGTASGRLLKTTGVDTAAEIAISAFGESLIDDADAAAARTTLGLDDRYRRTVQSEHGDPVRTICSNTTTEETALSYTIPADTLATHDVYYELEFDVLQNHGSTVANRMRINLGSTEAHSSSSSWTQNDPDRFQVSMWGTISSRGATNKQRVSWQAMAGTPISAGGQWINGDQRGNGANDTAEDSTGDLAFEVTFQWSATQSNGNFRIYRTRIELVPH